MQNLHMTMHAQLNLIHIYDFYAKDLLTKKQNISSNMSSIHSVHVRSHQGGSVLIIFLWYVAPTTWPPWFLSQSYIPCTNKSSASCATYATPLLSTSKFFLRLQVIHCDLWTSPTVSLTAATNMHGWAARQHARFSSRMYRDKHMLGAHDDAKIALLSQLLALASRA